MTKGETNMVGKSIKEIFKAINEMNNAMDILSTVGNRSELAIYIDDMKFYQGTSYKEFAKKVREEYVKFFAEEILNVLYCGSYKATVYDEITHWNSTIEVYIWDC